MKKKYERKHENNKTQNKKSKQLIEISLSEKIWTTFMFGG